VSDSAGATPLLIPDETVRRYDAAAVQGHRVLDLACGDGVTTVLLALRGAVVTGIDPSAEAIGVARSRAVANGVADRATFEVASINAGLDTMALGSFDLIYGPMVLHRIHADLDAMLPAVVRLARPGAILVFVEPVSVWSWRRGLRQRLRPQREGAQRPLDAADINAMRRHLPQVEVRYFGLFAMLLQRAGFAPVYEKSSVLERLAYDAAGIMDQFLFRVLQLRGLASSAVIIATLPPR
jgi:SAM-dependent methyltransferase